jgi:CHASE3 domain sensor protein
MAAGGPMIVKVKTWLALAGTVVLAMLGAFLWGAAKQKSNQKIRDLKARLSVRQNTKEIEDEVDLMSGDAVYDQLCKWLRDRYQR